MSEFEKAADINEIEPGGRKPIVVDESPALLVRAGDGYYAFDDICTHDGQAMTDGPIDGTEITCPRHGARFDITTGKAVCMPAFEAITVYEVEIRDDGIYVRGSG